MLETYPQFVVDLLSGHSSCVFRNKRHGSRKDTNRKRVFLFVPLLLGYVSIYCFYYFCLVVPHCEFLLLHANCYRSRLPLELLYLLNLILDSFKMLFSVVQKLTVLRSLCGKLVGYQQVLAINDTSFALLCSSAFNF